MQSFQSASTYFSAPKFRAAWLQQFAIFGALGIFLLASTSTSNAEDVVVDNMLTADSLYQDSSGSTADFGVVNTTSANVWPGWWNSNWPEEYYGVAMAVSGGMSVDWLALGAGLENPGTEIDGSFIASLNLVPNGDDAAFNSVDVGTAYFGDLSINGSLAVTGDFSGNLIMDGTLILKNVYNEANSHHDGTVLHIGDNLVMVIGGFYQNSTNIWKWQQNGAYGAVDQMILSGDGNLSLLNPDANATLRIDPESQSIVQTIGNTTTTYSLYNLTSSNTSATVFGLGAIRLDASDPDAPFVKLGNFSLTSNSSTDGLVITDSSSNNTVTLDPRHQSINFSEGMALNGNETTMRLVFGDSASGLAFGQNATASGNDSLAMQNSTASGNGSVAIGINSTASNDSAVALTSGNASGTNSVAIGPGATASGDNSIALGTGTVAQSWGVVVVGHYNTPISGNTSAWQSSDPAFVIGIGTNSTTGGRVNGMVVSNDGNTTINGYGDFLKRTNSTQPQLQVNGATLLNGKVELGGPVTMLPQGDVPMGEFGNDP